LLEREGYSLSKGPYYAGKESGFFPGDNIG